MKEKLDSAKNFVVRNKTKILAGALVVTTAYAAAMTRNKREFDKFLEEKDLLNEYYTPED